MTAWRSSSRKRKERALQKRNAERTRDEARVQHLGQIADSPVFQRVMLAQQLGTETVELTRALDIALNEPDVFARFRAGEPVFAPALLE